MSRAICGAGQLGGMGHKIRRLTRLSKNSWQSVKTVILLRYYSEMQGA
jgi:hypothetical protein